MPEARPNTVQLRVAPIAVPAIGTLQLPWATRVADGQERVPAVQRMS